MNQESLNKKVEDILNSADDVQRAEPRPFLFTRIEARMQTEKNIWSRLSTFVARPVVSIACVCLVIIINASVIFFSERSSVGAQQGQDVASADEYSQVNYTLYEFENVKP